MPRYQPLAVELSTTDIPRSGTRQFRRKAANAFYCDWCCAALGEFFENYVQYLPGRTEFVGYISGILFAVGWWIFIDGVAYSKSHPAVRDVPIRFEDWLPGLFSTLALIIVNSIDKEMLSGDDSSWGSTNVAAKARAWAFVGVSMSLASIGGSLAIMSLKYIMPADDMIDPYFGYCVAIQNAMIFIGSMVMWFGRNASTDGHIAL